MVRRYTGPRLTSVDSSSLRKITARPGRNYLHYGKVGHVDDLTQLPEPNPQFIRIEQGLVLVEVTMEPGGDQIIARLGMCDAGFQVADYVPLSFGCRVLLELVNGNPQNAVIMARLSDLACPLPPVVAGVQTGAAGAVAPDVGVPAPLWRFIRLGPGQIMAIETQVGGDVLIHSGASMELKTTLPAPTARIHLNGAVSMGVGPTVPPVGATVGPAGTAIPGVPAIPHIPIPALPSIPAPPLTIVPYVGNEDGVIRSKDAVQSHAGVDPSYWTWLLAVSTNPIILAGLVAAGIVPPVSLHSEHGGRNGPGSQHTGSD